MRCLASVMLTIFIPVFTVITSCFVAVLIAFCFYKSMYTDVICASIYAFCYV